MIMCIFVLPMDNISRVPFYFASYFLVKRLHGYHLKSCSSQRLSAELISVPYDLVIGFIRR